MKNGKCSNMFIAMVSVLTFLCIALMPTASYAGQLEGGKQLSFDEYYSILQAEYAKHGIGLTVEGGDHSKVFTSLELEKEIQEINPNPVSDATHIPYDQMLDSVNRIPMPTNRSFFARKVVSPNGHPSCTATITFEVSAVIDAQYNSIMSINRATTYCSSPGPNFYTWRQNSARAWVEDSSHLAGSANGQAEFREQVGGGQVNVYTVNVNFGTQHWAV